MARVGYGLAPGGSGEWTFVAGRAFLAAVPAGTFPGIVAKLTGLVAEPRIDIESLVSLLPLAGERALASFVVVVPGEPTDGDGIPVSVVARGRVAVDVFSVGGSRRFTDRDIRPWLLADFRSVIGLVIGSPLAAVVHASRLDSGRTAETGTIGADTLFWSLSAPSVRDDDTISRRQAALPQPAALPVPAPGTQPLSPADADTVVRPPQAAQDTVIIRRRDRGKRQPAAEPAPVARGAHYGFRLPGGEERRLDAVYFLGRRPRSPRITGDLLPRLITVSSPSSAVSATHLEIRQEGDTVVVTDLNSTNGTIVNPPRGRRQRLGSGQSLVVAPGTTVDIGDGNIVEVLPSRER